jgi:phage baseplate assembly protein W
MVTRLPLGFPLLQVPDARGELNFPSAADSVRQMIQVILRTRPGEQLMRPDFGAGLDELVHEPNTALTRRRIRDLVDASIRRWEPRIDLERVDVSEIAGAPARVRVEIIYRLRGSTALEQIGLRMELGG